MLVAKGVQYGQGVSSQMMALTEGEDMDVGKGEIARCCRALE